MLAKTYFAIQRKKEAATWVITQTVFPCSYSVNIIIQMGKIFWIQVKTSVYFAIIQPTNGVTAYIDQSRYKKNVVAWQSTKYYIAGLANDKKKKSEMSITIEEAKGNRRLRNKYMEKAIDKAS